MKKTSIIMVFVATASVVLFQSFTNNSPAKSGMKKNVHPAMTLTNVNMSNNRNGYEVESVEKSASIVNTNSPITINYQNMQEAYKGETTASAKYAAYSKKAEEEGYHQIALLYKAASTSENIHASNHKAVLKSGGQKIPVITPKYTVKSTKENLKDAIAGETYEINTMYPEFIINANAAGNQFALISLNYAYKTEQKHKPLYEKALAALESNNVKSLPTVYYVCPTCGNTYDTSAPQRCGISMTSSEKFIKITSLN